MDSRLSRRLFLGSMLSVPVAGALPTQGRGAAPDATWITDIGKLIEPLPFEMPSPGTLMTSPKKVVAHWHVFPRSFDNKPEQFDYYTRDQMTPEGAGGQYRDSGGFILERPIPRAPIPKREWAIDDMAQDIREAHAIGIDGFQMNIAWIADDFFMWKHFLALQDAVLLSGLPFRIMVNFDCHTKPTDGLLKLYLNSIAKAWEKGGLMTTDDGRLIISAFMAEAWPAAFWRRMFDGFADRGIRTSFMPMFLNITKATPDYLAMTDVVSCWTGNHMGGIKSFADYGRTSAARGTPWMAPIFPQDCRPKDKWFAEARNSEVFRTGWMTAIVDGAAHACVITWNDYSESSEIRPSTGIQYGFYDLAAYYVAWFKTGAPPPIRSDALYYFHRVQPTSGPDLGRKQQKKMVMHKDMGPGPFNEIELLAFLTEPGRLEIETAEGITAEDVTAGMRSIRAPLVDGTPRFRLVRVGRTIIDFASAFTVRSQSDYQDLLYRAGSSNRPPVAGLSLGRS